MGVSSLFDLIWLRMPAINVISYLWGNKITSLNLVVTDTDSEREHNLFIATFFGTILTKNTLFDIMFKLENKSKKIATRTL